MTLASFVYLGAFALNLLFEGMEESLQRVVWSHKLKVVTKHLEHFCLNALEFLTQIVLNFVILDENHTLVASLAFRVATQPWHKRASRHCGGSGGRVSCWASALKWFVAWESWHFLGYQFIVYFGIMVLPQFYIMNDCRNAQTRQQEKLDILFLFLNLSLI